MSRYGVFTTALLLVACTAEPESKTETPIDVDAAGYAAGDTSLRRLSQLQYRNTIRDLVGAEVVVPPQLEPDVSVDGQVSIGSARSTFSPLGVERFESAALKIADQAMNNPKVAGRLISCKPAKVDDAACMKTFVREFGKKAWRRPLTPAEEDRVADVGLAAAVTQGTFKQGALYAMAALLQSPNFLFRVELGRGGAFDDWEMASRLSYFLTNTTPDDELLAAAERGELTAEAGLRAQAERLMEQPAAREAVRNFFAEIYQLYALDSLSKDTTVFTFMDAELGPAAREETLALIEYIVFEKDADFRSFFTTTETFVNRRLAALYEVAAPVTDGFGRVTLPSKLRRRGFLGHVSFLAQQAHPLSTSAVLRGRFVRTALLCGEVPPPPADLNTGIPEPSANARTLKERSLIHQKEPFCAGCHSLMDPIGLGFENFDAIGRWRKQDNGAEIDPRGEIDGTPYADAWSLAGVVAKHPDVPYCLTRSAFRYATGHVEALGETDFLTVLTAWFAQSGYRIKPLFIELASSRAFRTAGANP